MGKPCSALSSPTIEPRVVFETKIAMDDQEKKPDLAGPPPSDTVETPLRCSPGAEGSNPAPTDQVETKSNIVPMHEVIAVVGGPPDECGVTLAIYGEDLDPDEITRLLGVHPTHSHRRGDRHKPDSRFPFQQGAWFLERRGMAPVCPDELTKEVLDQLPTEMERWRLIKERFDIRLLYGLHFSGWNKGLDLPRELVARIAAIGASMGFDIYMYGEEEGPLQFE